MLYSEAAYFDNNHCAHCATRDDYNRLQRIDRANRAAMRNINRKVNK